MNKTRILFLLLFALLLAARLCHVEILWAEETLPLAAAQQMRAGKVLYRDVWFDKPPAAPLLYRALGSEPGSVLRAAGALYALLCCWIAFAFARDLWGEREGRWAAGLLGFFLVFDFPSSVIPLAADLLMLAPHLAAVWMAWKRRPLWAGALAGVAFAVNPKGLLVLAACAPWDGLLLLTGFATVTAIASAWMWGAGALPGYWDEVWRWGRVYAGTTFVENPLLNGAQRTLNWAGFHVAAVAGAVLGWRHADDKRRLWIPWLGFSLLGVVGGLRFFPRYYFQILPVVVLLAARGFALAQRKHVYLLAALLVIPLVRFGPHTAVRGEWRDTAMDAIAARRGDPSRRGSCGRLAVRLGLPPGDLRLFASARVVAIPRFAAADRRAGRPPPDAIRAGGDRGGAGKARGVGADAAGVHRGRAGSVQPASGARRV